jgi:sigma-E factor negative regulatory protein RseC
MENEISHEGVVQSATAGSVTVLLSPGISCSGCQAEKSCGIAGSEHKMINIDGSFSIVPGEKVLVSMQKSQGFSALFLGYILPLMVVVISLVTLISLKINELSSGLISVGLLIPYYGLLFIFRRSINRKFRFTLKRIA